MAAKKKKTVAKKNDPSKKTAKKVKRKSYGLTGNTGVIRDDSGAMVMHLNMPYDSNDGVFIGDYQSMSWERVTKEKAKKNKLTPIKCSYCAEPAVRLDHSWPYLSSMTSCAQHLVGRIDADD